MTSCNMMTSRRRHMHKQYWFKKTSLSSTDWTHIHQKWLNAVGLPYECSMQTISAFPRHGIPANSTLLHPLETFLTRPISCPFAIEQHLRTYSNCALAQVLQFVVKFIHWASTLCVDGGNNIHLVKFGGNRTIRCDVIQLFSKIRVFVGGYVRFWKILFLSVRVSGQCQDEASC